jgi:hypothetical protein
MDQQSLFIVRKRETRNKIKNSFTKIQECESFSKSDEVTFLR